MSSDAPRARTYWRHGQAFNRTRCKTLAEHLRQYVRCAAEPGAPFDGHPGLDQSLLTRDVVLPLFDEGSVGSLMERQRKPGTLWTAMSHIAEHRDIPPHLLEALARHTERSGTAGCISDSLCALAEADHAGLWWQVDLQHLVNQWLRNQSAGELAVLLYRLRERLLGSATPAPSEDLVECIALAETPPLLNLHVSLAEASWLYTQVSLCEVGQPTRDRMAARLESVDIKALAHRLAAESDPAMIARLATAITKLAPSVGVRLWHCIDKDALTRLCDGEAHYCWLFRHPLKAIGEEVPHDPYPEHQEGRFVKHAMDGGPGLSGMLEHRPSVDRAIICIGEAEHGDGVLAPRILETARIDVPIGEVLVFGKNGQFETRGWAISVEEPTGRPRRDASLRRPAGDVSSTYY